MAGKNTQQRGMLDAHENGKESSHSAHVNGMNEWMNPRTLSVISDKQTWPKLLESHKLKFCSLYFTELSCIVDGEVEISKYNNYD